MTHWKLTLAYDGTHFHGWQVQPDLETVQGLLRRKLEQVVRGPVTLPQGSGRTDAGVHALGQVASFTLEAAIPAENLVRALNRALPASVRVLGAEEVTAEFHARHSAVGKTYEYRIFPRVSGFAASGLEHARERVCPPFLAPYVWDCPWYVDLGRARQAAAQIVGEHDFTSFAAVDPELREGERAEARPGLKTIYRSEWIKQDGLLVYRVEGSGFLHHMVRNLVGTFVDVARGRGEAEEIRAVLEARDRSAAGPTAPAQGLFLVGVEYGQGTTGRQPR